MTETNVLTFVGLTDQQQAIEKLWTILVNELSGGRDKFEFTIPSSIAVEMGKQGSNAIAQRCKFFNDSSVKVRPNPDCSVNLEIISGDARRRQEDEQIARSGDGATLSAQKTVPRPRNCFILYRQHHHFKMVAEYPHLHNNQISQLIGAMWKQEPQPVRDAWKHKADVERMEHERDFPGYSYQPRKPGIKKRRATKKITSRNTTAATASGTKEGRKRAAPRQNASERPTPAPSGTDMLDPALLEPDRETGPPSSPLSHEYPSIPTPPALVDTQGDIFSEFHDVGELLEREMDGVMATAAMEGCGGSDLFPYLGYGKYQENFGHVY